MECLEIDWKSIDETFVKDEFYEAIQAPKWVDFTAPEQHLDDTEWFCGKAGCSHAKKPAPQPCSLAGKAKAPFKERLRVLDAEPQNPAASMAIIPPEKIAVSALTRGVISTSLNSILGMKSKPLPQKNKAFMQGKITSTIRCKITSENDNPNQVAKQIPSSTTLFAGIRFPENAVRKANRVETRDLSRPLEVKVLPKRPLARALCKEEQVHKKCNTGNNSLSNASDSYVHRKPITGKQEPSQGYSYGKSCKSAKLATKSATQSKRILSACRLNRDCRASAKTKQLRNSAMPEGPASLSLIDAHSGLSTTCSSASQESGDMKRDSRGNLIRFKDLQLVNQVIVETEVKDSIPEQLQEGRSKQINDGKVATVEQQNGLETKLCQGGNSTQESRILEGLLTKLILTNSYDNEKHYEEDVRPQEKDKPEEERESKEEIQERPNEQAKGRKRKSTELNFKLNCSSKEHGKKYNKIMMPTPSSTSASQSVVSGRRPRPIAGFCAGQHKKLRFAIASPVKHKPSRLVPQVKGTLREPDLCPSSIVTETQTEVKEEIKNVREQMMHHALKMPFFGKPFKPQRSTKKLTVPKEPRFHTRERKTCIKNRIAH